MRKHDFSEFGEIGIMINQELDNLYKNLSKKKGVSKKLEDDGFVFELKEIYSWIDVDKELAKMDAWLLANPSRKKTKRFILNWLNKIDCPLEIKKSKNFADQVWGEK